MGLTLNGEQVELMRTALLEYQREIRDQERYHCAGPSSLGIELCRRRLVLDSILSEIDHQDESPAAGARGKVLPFRAMGRFRMA